MTQKADPDDYLVLYFDTREWDEFMDKQDYEHR